MLDVLAVREAREAFIQGYFNTNRKALAVIRANYPGRDKRNPYTSYVSYIFRRILSEKGLETVKTEFEGEGLVYYMSSDLSAEDLKSFATDLEEEHFLGRFIDIDVYGKSGQISRGFLRKCFICDEDAAVCIRNRKHSQEEIEIFFKSRVEEFIFQEPYKRIAEFAMISELSRSASLGTINFVSEGSHRDMKLDDYYKSIDLLCPMFEKISDCKNFEETRKLGMEIEELMRREVGVNTYQGLIFHLLLLYLSEKISNSRENFRKNIKKFGELSMEDFKSGLAEFSKDFYEYGFSGARGAAASGYKIVFDTDLNRLNTDELFIEIAKKNKDTNILRRAGIEIFKDYLDKINNIRDEETLRLAEEFAIEHNISAGGSADILACSYAIMMIYKKNKWEWSYEN